MQAAHGRTEHVVIEFEHGSGQCAQVDLRRQQHDRISGGSWSGGFSEEVGT